MTFKEYKAKLRARAHDKLPPVSKQASEEPVPGQRYRVGDLPPGSVVQGIGDRQYVVGRNGCAMLWEQPIPGSEDWQLPYVSQLPPGEWMTDKQWAEVAATGSQPEVSEDLFEHPDPWMDNEPGTLTLPPPGQWPRMAAHGLIPCPYCGGDIQDQQGGRAMVCAGCGHTWPTDTDEEFNRAMQQIHPANLDTRSCPKCGSTMHWRDGASLGRLYPNGAWECSNMSCWHMAPPGEMMPDTYQDPDAPGDFTLPEEWA